MIYGFDGRASDSPLVEKLWRTHSEGGGLFTSSAETHWEMVITKRQGETTLTVRGPETLARPAPVPDGEVEYFGIVFRPGAFLAHLPGKKLVEHEVNLPFAGSKSVWLAGAAWELPTFDNADVFIERMVRQGLLVHDPIIEDALQSRLPDLSLRSVQRRFLHATGLTYSTYRQIERAHQAAAMLGQGASILDVTYHFGYADQPHMTRSFKRFLGTTPAQLFTPSEQMSFLFKTPDLQFS
jgi:AraC-like DNA-binding protein